MKYMDVETFNIVDSSIICDLDLSNCCELDDEIAEVIGILNKKGYRTAFCCSGHSKSQHEQEVAYIQFGFGEITPEKLPEGWKYIEDGHMEYTYTSFSVKELEHEIATVMAQLYIWACDLPELY